MILPKTHEHKRNLSLSHPTKYGEEKRTNLRPPSSNTSYQHHSLPSTGKEISSSLASGGNKKERCLKRRLGEPSINEHNRCNGAGYETGAWGSDTKKLRLLLSEYSVPNRTGYEAITRQEPVVDRSFKQDKDITEGTKPIRCSSSNHAASTTRISHAKSQELEQEYSDCRFEDRHAALRLLLQEYKRTKQQDTALCNEDSFSSKNDRVDKTAFLKQRHESLLLEKYLEQLHNPSKTPLANLDFFSTAQSGRSMRALPSTYLDLNPSQDARALLQETLLGDNSLGENWRLLLMLHEELALVRQGQAVLYHQLLRESLAKQELLNLVHQGVPDPSNDGMLARHLKSKSA